MPGVYERGIGVTRGATLARGSGVVECRSGTWLGRAEDAPFAGTEARAGGVLDRVCVAERGGGVLDRICATPAGVAERGGVLGRAGTSLKPKGLAEPRMRVDEGAVGLDFNGLALEGELDGATLAGVFVAALVAIATAFSGADDAAAKGAALSFALGAAPSFALSVLSASLAVATAVASLAGISNGAGVATGSSSPKSPQSESMSSVGGIIDCSEAWAWVASIFGDTGTGCDTVATAAGCSTLEAVGTAPETKPGASDAATALVFSAVPCRRLDLPLVARLLIAWVPMLARMGGTVRGSRGVKERACRCVQ